MQLRDVVQRYRKLSGGFGRPVALSQFGLSREETERLFSVFDEDYQISRFLRLSNQEGETYQINGFAYTHVSMDAGIETIL